MRAIHCLSVPLLVLVGCASAPKISYYTLDMAPSGQAKPAHNLVVERFRTSEAVARSQILIHASPTEVDYYATDQWVAGRGERVQQKLAAEFGQPVEGRRTLIVSGTVLACGQVDRQAGAEAAMTLQIAVRDAAGKRYREPLIDRTYTATRTASADPASVVAALSRCAEEIAAAIAGDTSRLETPDP